MCPKWLWVLFCTICLTTLVIAKNAPPQGAESPPHNCSSASDSYLGNAQTVFSVGSWITRGLCIRRGLGAWGEVPAYDCYNRLESVLKNNLNEVRAAEYAGAAGVLALLPTIGALLGTPTNEIWRLLTMIPFGGLVAMACSFGGAILPVKVKDYESDFMKKNIRGALRTGRSPSTLALPTSIDAADQDKIRKRADILLDRVTRKLGNKAREKVPKMYIIVGLSGMTILLAASQAAMIIVELGAVLPWWCQSKWWVHLWYLMVLVSAAIDNYVQLPFDKQWQLCLSDIPHDITVEDGDLITSHEEGKEVEGMKIALAQLRTLKTGTVRFASRPQAHAEARNVLFVMVSVAGHSHNWRKTFTRSVSKITSIAVYVVGTACFASAQLLSIAMATFVLTCVLGAGVFGRAITSWIVTGIETKDPMVHYVADSEGEALYVLARLFLIGPTGSTDFQLRQTQVELSGQIFIDRRRVAARMRYMPLIFGILTSPFDLTKIGRVEKGRDEAYDLEDVLPSENGRVSHHLLRPSLTPRATFGSGSTIESGAPFDNHMHG